MLFEPNMSILKDRNLNRAILVSAISHVIFIITVNPVISGLYSRNNPAKIYFLGSILEKVVPMTEKLYDVEDRHAVHSIESVRRMDKETFRLTPPEAALRPIIDLSDKEDSAANAVKKEAVFSKIFSRKPAIAIFKIRTDEIKGDAANRLLLYKPDLPKISIISSDFFSGYRVVLKARISRDGFVEEPEIIVSSGSPKIDQMAVRYVRGWQFAPLLEEMQDGQAGIISINL